MLTAKCNHFTISTSYKQAGEWHDIRRKTPRTSSGEATYVALLAEKVGVGFTYLSKIENHKLEEGHGPSEKLIHKLATELDGSEDELLLLADKVPEAIRRRVKERPEEIQKLASLHDKTLDGLMTRVVGKRSASRKADRR